MADTSGEVTQMLNAWAAGDDAARDDLFEIVHPEIRAIALRQRRSFDANLTLQATEIVHEAYLKLVGQPQSGWSHRAQFFKLAAQVLRQVLVDYYRGKKALKRGGDVERCEVPVDELVSADNSVDVLSLDEALGRLTEFDPLAARVVELRYFAGLTIPETAEALATGTATVSRRWQVARAWLHRELSEVEEADPEAGSASS